MLFRSAAFGSRHDGRADAAVNGTSTLHAGASSARAAVAAPRPATDAAAVALQCRGVSACRGWCRKHNPVCTGPATAETSKASGRGAYGVGAGGTGGVDASGAPGVGAGGAGGVGGGVVDWGAPLSSLVSESALRQTLAKPPSSCGRSGQCRFRVVSGSLYRSEACNPRRPNWQLLTGLMVSAVARAEASGRGPLPDVEVCMHQVKTSGADVIGNPPPTIPRLPPTALHPPTHSGGDHPPPTALQPPTHSGGEPARRRRRTSSPMVRSPRRSPRLPVAL